MSRRVCIVVVVPLLCAACVGEITGHAPFEDVEVGLTTLEGNELAAELASSPVREAPTPFWRLGLIWDADRPAAFEVTTSADGGIWSPWTAPLVHSVEMEERASFVGQIEVEGEPARFYRLRGIPGATATFLRLELIGLTQSESVEDGDPEPPPTTYARTIGGVEVKTRSDWGARKAKCSTPIGDVYRMAIHHTESPTNDSLSPEARLRQIQSYHMDVKGWCDIGYHYLISRDGRIWEGRPESLLGTHAGGANTGNLGVSVMGSHDATPVTDTQLDRMAALVGTLARAHGVPIDRTRIKGHREYKATSCPGNRLFAQLNELVTRARAYATGTTPPPDPGAPPATGGRCTLPTDGPWSCGGLAGTTTNAAGTYYTTSFGCWVDDSGAARGDSADDCVPACSLSSIGCAGMTGPACERYLNWYAAGADRFGCGTKIKVTNPDNGRSAVLIVIDRGPSCTIERTVNHWVLDMSYRASYYLFGGPTAASERADVQVEVVDPSTPIGPHDGPAMCAGGSGGGGGTSGGSSGETVTVMGVLYVGSDPSDRIAGATVTLGSRSTTTDADGFWRFADVPVGSFTVTASKTGYQTRSVTRSTYAAETWASFGLSPTGATTGTAVLQGVVYYGSSSTNRIPGAQISLSTGHTITADANGFYKLSGLPAGPVTITATAPGYSAASVERTLVDGATEWGSVRLAR